jgi:hypothetical protein
MTKGQANLPVMQDYGGSHPPMLRQDSLTKAL